MNCLGLKWARERVMLGGGFHPSFLLEWFPVSGFELVIVFVIAVAVLAVIVSVVAVAAVILLVMMIL